MNAAIAENATVLLKDPNTQKNIVKIVLIVVGSIIGLMILLSVLGIVSSAVTGSGSFGKSSKNVEE